MAVAPLSTVVGHLSRTVRSDPGLTDEQLLRSFQVSGDAAAFECLVWRHGPAVLGVCRRILGNEADADDAFQATFLVFLRKSKSVRPQSAIGAWLYGVACNVARKARGQSVRRRSKELLAAPRSEPKRPEPDLKPTVDAELERLPQKYRVPVILCELEGQPIAETARQLGWPQGTVASRLARGRDILARRLARHDLTLAGLATATLSAELVARVVNRSVSSNANRFAHSALRGMLLAKFKLVSAVVVGIAVMFVGGMAWKSMAGNGEKPPANEPQKNEKAPGEGPPKTVEAKPEANNTLIGRWRNPGEHTYRTLEFRSQPGAGLMIAENKDYRADWFTWKLDPEGPGTIDVSARVEGKSVSNRGIYRFEGDRLRIYLGAYLQFQGDPGKHARPTEFDLHVKLGEGMFLLEREQVAWGKVDDIGLQYGVRIEPPGTTTVPLGSAATFTVLVQNTTNKAIDVDLPKFDGNPYEWTLAIVGPKGEAIAHSHPIAIPGIGKPSTRMKAKLTDYGVAEVGSFSIGLLPSPAGAVGIFPAPFALLSPGEHTFQFSTKLDKNRTISTGQLKLIMDHAVAWGPNIKGLEFGLAFGKGQSNKIHIGEQARFRVFVRNTSEKELKIGTLQAIHLPMFAEPAFRHGDVKGPIVRLVRGPEVRPPPPNLTILSGQTVEVPGEFTLPFVPHALAGETHVVAKLGNWPMSIPNLDTWVAGNVRYGTGELDVEIVPGDVAHVDSQRIAWGQVVEGIQFGLKSDKTEYPIGDTVKLSVQARNVSDKDITFRFPHLSGWWPNNGRPNIRDAAGKEVVPHLAVPRGPIGPQGVVEHTLKVGEIKELTSVSWPFVAPGHALTEDRDYVVLDKSGAYTFQYPDLHAKNKPAWPTGEVPLKFWPPFNPPPPAWGREKDGLQFGLSLGRNQANTVRIGESVRVQIWVKNLTDQEQAFSALPESGLSYTLMPEVSSGGKSWQSGKNPPPGPPLPRTERKVPPRSVQLVAEMDYDLLPGFQPGCNGLKAETGTWDIRFADLAPWLTSEGYATGKLAIDVLAGDVEHLDKNGVSWGKVVDGVQIGIAHLDPARTEFKLRDSLAVRLWVRNFSGAILDVALPSAVELWKAGIHPVVRDAKGNVMPIGLPIMRFEPPGIREQTLRIGQKEEWGKIEWPLADPGPSKAREFNVPTILVDPGEHTIHFAAMPANKKSKATIATGPLKFAMK